MSDYFIHSFKLKVNLGNGFKEDRLDISISTTNICSWDNETHIKMIEEVINKLCVHAGIQSVGQDLYTLALKEERKQ